MKMALEVHVETNCAAIANLVNFGYVKQLKYEVYYEVEKSSQDNAGPQSNLPCRVKSIPNPIRHITIQIKHFVKVQFGCETSKWCVGLC